MVPSLPEWADDMECKTAVTPAKPSGAVVHMSARRDPQKTIGRHPHQDHRRTQPPRSIGRDGPDPTRAREPGVARQTPALHKRAAAR
jgi:hypothetical protein